MQASPWKLIVGAFLGIGSICLAYLSGDDARHAYLGASDPEVASKVQPTDALSLASSLDSREQREGRAAPTAAEMRNIAGALARQPLSRGLLRQVGAKAEADSDSKRADLAFELSNGISRRDALTQLWLIERSVQKNDLRSAVQHYHAVLSTHTELYKVLLPILGKAVAHPEVRTALRPYMVQQAAWIDNLLDPRWSQIDPADAVKLIDPVPETVRGDNFEAVIGLLFTGLAERGQFTEAGHLAQRVMSSFDPRMIASFTVSDRTQDRRLGALAWTLSDTGRLLATANERGGFDVDVEALDQGVVATRIVSVMGGRNYTFRQSVRGSDTASADFTWEAACVPSGGIFWHQRFSAPDEVRHDEFLIAVPQACKGLRFTLSARGPEGQEGAHVTFEGLDFSPRLN